MIPADYMTSKQFQRAKEGINKALRYIDVEQEDLDLINQLIEVARLRINDIIWLNAMGSEGE